MIVIGSPIREWTFVDSNEIAECMGASGSACASGSATGAIPKMSTPPDYAELSRALSSHIEQQQRGGQPQAAPTAPTAPTAFIPLVAPIVPSQDKAQAEAANSSDNSTEDPSPKPLPTGWLFIYLVYFIYFVFS